MLPHIVISPSYGHLYNIISMHRYNKPRASPRLTRETPPPSIGAAATQRVAQ